MTDLPEQLTPPDGDLRDFPFTPIFRARLFSSRFHSRATDAEWRAGVTLWLKSWDQVPAGSLPDDDIDLCRLAELGRDQRQWAKVKDIALRGWIKCTDGLLYHQVVAEGVNEALARKRNHSVRGKAGAAAKWRKHEERMQQASEEDGASIKNGMQTDAEAMLGDGNRQGQGQREEKKDSLILTFPQPTPPASQKRKTVADGSLEFDRFWALYPRKVGKDAARKSFSKALKNSNAEDILAGLRRYSFSPDPQYQPHASTWLHEGRWKIEEDTRPPNSGRPTSSVDGWNNF
jgi:hypothetical protein